jgi:hypothetical protein
MEEQKQEEQIINEEQKNKDRNERLIRLKINNLEQNMKTLNALKAKHTYKFTRAGKTKRS